MNNAALDEAILRAHAKDDHAALVQLYTQAADKHESAGDIDTACFFLTQAFVFALEQGAPDVIRLNQRLVAHGRAQPITGPIHD